MSTSLRELREKNKKSNKKNVKPTNYTKPKSVNSSLLSSIDECYITIPDVHSYERDTEAFDLMMDAVKVLGDSYPVKKIIQLGDLMECGEMSSHPPSHINEVIPSYVDEIEWAVDGFWKPLMKSCPDAEFHALLGNHEHRVNKWLMDRLGKSKISMQMYNQLNPTDLYKSMGINVVPYGNENPIDGTLEIFPGLVCVHGWSFSLNCAKAHLDKMMGATSVIFGHTHRIQSYIRRNPMTNQLVGAWNIGALAKTNLLYNRGQPTDHALGFGVVFTYKNGFTVNTLPILGNEHKYVILPNGAIVSK